jgi:excinuclease ABC subunit A
MSETKDHTEFDDYIEVYGAREHNLQNISVRIPRNSMVVITGISGSGKSSLAFDTIYAEGQRRYMETFSNYVRQFLGEMERPDVERIEGLSPVISIEQKTTGWNPRSTVGTITEVYDFLRLLYARAGDAYSYVTGEKMIKYSEDQIFSLLTEQYEGRKIALLAPLVRARKGHYRELFEHVRKQGYTRVRVDGEVLDLVPGLQVDRYKIHDIEVVVDRLRVDAEKKRRLLESLQAALKLGNGLIFVEDIDTGKVDPYSRHLMCPESGISYEEPSPNTFSFNSPYGACPHCKGLGHVHQVDMEKVIPDEEKSINEIGIAPLGEVRENSTFKALRKLTKKYRFSFATPIREIPEQALEQILYGDAGRDGYFSQDTTDSYANVIEGGLTHMIKRWYVETSSEKIRSWAEDFMTISDCPECGGFRLKVESLHFKMDGKHIGELAMLDLTDLSAWFEGLEDRISDRQRQIARDVIKEIRLRIRFLLHVGLNYLHLNRQARTLSGGEAQRTRLATQIGSQLTGITYILDEPSIGLHQRDNQRLIVALKELVAIGNTVLVVEHDKDIMMASDYVIDLGPGAGRHGGHLVGEGVPDDFLQLDTLTAKYLDNRISIPIPAKRREGTGQRLVLSGATGHNLQDVTLRLPLGTFTCITGVSGSGKSSLINETLYPLLRNRFHRSIKKPLPYAGIKGMSHLDKVIEIDQSPIGRTPRSNPATYTGVFTDIRKLFSDVPESKIRGYKPGRFSFNVKGGRCETCGGGGMRTIEMNFLPDVLVDCETCMGKRYNRETLEILYKGKTISEVLAMTVEDATEFFKPIPAIFRKLRTLRDVGLGYITLGQQATTLSGGEAQRVKLSEELSKRDTGNTLYILDEPTTGLHFEDVKHLLEVLNKLVEKGNTVIVIEHNMDVIKVADHIIDLGPEGGRGGGQIIAEGTPEDVVKIPNSYTGQFLKHEFHHLVTG